MAVRGRQSKGMRANKPEWARTELRLDPYALPQKLNNERAALSPRGERVEFTLDLGGAVMKRDLSCGLPLSMALPAKAFQGVAARAYENSDGSNTVTLELLHHDADLSVPLCVSDTVEDAAADWHSWAKRMGLPMLLVDTKGQATVVKDYAGVSSLAPKPRRRRSSMMKHRPNFLRRRKPGMIGPVVRVTGEEIIART